MKEFFLAFVPILIAVDPIGILPIFLGIIAVAAQSGVTGGG